VPVGILYRLTSCLLFNQFRDPGQDPKLYLFGQLKRILREWVTGGYVRCTGGTYPGQLIYQDIADRACERVKAAITESMVREHPIKGCSTRTILA
jgi:type III restriction enzyme